MITVFLCLWIVIVFMQFAHELEEKLSLVYNYTAIQTQPGEPKAICCDKNTNNLCKMFETIPVSHKNTILITEKAFFFKFSRMRLKAELCFLANIMFKLHRRP